MFIIAIGVNITSALLFNITIVTISQIGSNIEIQSLFKMLN